VLVGRAEFDRPVEESVQDHHISDEVWEAIADLAFDLSRQKGISHRDVRRKNGR
jgi:hypothetical protein